MERAKGSSPFGSSFIDGTPVAPESGCERETRRRARVLECRRLADGTMRSQKSLTLLPNRQGRPRRLLVARKRILAQHPLKRG
jgi:hypothetical protein